MFEIDPVEDLAAAVDWFVEAIGPRTRVPIRRVTNPTAAARGLAELERRIVPFELPPELLWFWETWDPSGFDVLPTPPLHGAEWQVQQWSFTAWDGSGYEAPRALLPIGSAGHDFLLMDLSRPSGTPASLWSYSISDPDLACEAPSLAALFRTFAEHIEGANIDRPKAASPDVDWQDQYETLFNQPEFRATMDRHFRASSSTRQQLPASDPATWLDRWVDAQGAMTGGSEPRGRTHSVAEFIALLGTGHPRARLRGQLSEAGAFDQGPDILMRLQDFTGIIDVAVPPNCLAPGWGWGDDLEIEVVGRGPLPPRPRPRQPAPEPDDSVAEHGRALGEFKGLIPLVVRTDRFGA